MNKTLSRLIDQYKSTRSTTVEIPTLDELTEEEHLSALKESFYIFDYTLVQGDYWLCELAPKAINEAAQIAQMAQSASPKLGEVNKTSTNAPKANNQPKEKDGAKKYFDINQINQPLWFGIGFCVLGWLFNAVDETLGTAVLVIGIIFVMIGLLVHNLDKPSANKPALRVERELHYDRERLNGPAVRLNNYGIGHMDIRGFWYPYANSVGGWSVKYDIENIGARQIKYVDITLAAYNAVGDKCYCRTHGYTDVTCRFTGPLNAGSSAKWILFENLWYNIAMSRVSVEHIHIDFMDGKSQDIDKNGKVTNHGF